jgi:hypothetical protein
MSPKKAIIHKLYDFMDDIKLAQIRLIPGVHELCIDNVLVSLNMQSSELEQYTGEGVRMILFLSIARTTFHRGIHRREGSAAGADRGANVGGWEVGRVE